MLAYAEWTGEKKIPLHGIRPYWLIPETNLEFLREGLVQSIQQAGHPNNRRTPPPSVMRYAEIPLQFSARKFSLATCSSYANFA